MNKKERPLILITNDDGVFAKGINALVEVALSFGDVVVFAPDAVRSGMSNAITPHSPVVYSKLSSEEGLTVYSCTGTPTDCVKLSCYTLFKDRKPDLLLSGINHGSNASINVIYSGTMGAALEGCANQIPSIGFSLCDHSWDADFSISKPYIKSVIGWVLENPFPEGVCLNVNIPKGDVKGMKICRQAVGHWEEEFETRQDKNGSTVYWLTGKYVNREPDAEDTDDWALENGYVSIVPTLVDLSHKEHINVIKDWELKIDAV
jgi:5'-nucleotidase